MCSCLVLSQVSWDRSGKTDWYPTGFLCHFALSLCDQDEGAGTTGFLEGVSSMRLLTNRMDLAPRCVCLECSVFFSPAVS